MSEDKLKISGEIVKFLEVKSGTSKAGKAWTSQDFVIDTGASYDPEVCIGVFGQEKVDELSEYKAGQNVEVYFNVKSRAWQDKYFTSLQAWKINASNNASNDDDDSDQIPF